MSSESSEPQREMSIQEAMALGNHALKTNQLEAAGIIYGRVLEAWPDCPDALHFSGLLAFQQQKRDEAISRIQRSLELAPQHAGYWNNFGNVLKALNRLPEAATAYERAVAIHPDFADAHNNLGVLASQRGDFAAAVAEYQKVLAVDAGRDETWANLGNALEKLDRLDESVDAFNRAIELAPSDADSYGRLAYVRWRQGRIDDAVEVLARIIHLNPRDARSFSLMAGFFYSHGRTEEAFEAYAKALEIEPTNSGVNILYGQSLNLSGRPEQAREVWQRWRDADPENPIPRHLLQAGADETVPERSGDDFIVKIFDGFANSFDKQLEKLEYKAPTFVGEAVSEICGQPEGKLVILDAGCGTGLCGPLLRPYAQRLDGVDLSSKMLEKAKERGGYDELVAAELTAFIESRKDTYDVIACADTLCYFGKLEPVLAAAAGSLRSGGVFVFTLEKTSASKDAQKVTLEHTGRYTHTEAYVQSAVAGAGLNLARITTKTLRMEFFKPVEGMVVVAQKRERGSP